jgi:hypothetical protein
MWIITAWQCISPEVILKGFKKCYVSNVVDGTDDNSCGMVMKRMGMFSECEKDEGTVKMETVTLIGKGR